MYITTVKLILDAAITDPSAVDLAELGQAIAACQRASEIHRPDKGADPLPMYSPGLANAADLLIALRGALHRADYGTVKSLAAQARQEIERPGGAPETLG